MRYIRTKDGRIVDVQKFIEETKDTPYYYDFKFDEIKNEGDSCALNWTAVGSKENTIKEQVGKRCQFGVTIDSPFIAQADTIEELCDEIIIKRYDEPTPHNSPIGKSKSWKAYQPIVKEVEAICGAIWTEGDKGEPILKSVAQMNEEGDLELL